MMRHWPPFVKSNQITTDRPIVGRCFLHKSHVVVAFASLFNPRFRHNQCASPLIQRRRIKRIFVGGGSPIGKRFLHASNPARQLVASRPLHAKQADSVRAVVSFTSSYVPG
jgi:hypothetical protein